MTKYLIAIVGPTAIGKTSLSIALAKYFNTAIVSCDSRQVFKEMTIGTAVPSKEELASAKHYFIQSKSIFEPYNVGQFEREALETLNTLFATKDVVIMVGGSGLYADAVINGLDYFPDVDPDIRIQLKKELKDKGLENLQLKLKELDIDSYNNLEIDNPQRVCRALEICIGTGKTYSSFKNKEKTKRPFKTILIGLDAERKILYERINKRVDIMFTEGLKEEAFKLYPSKDLNALQTVGYKEFFQLFDGNYNIETTSEEIKKNTRRFAKRQLTWFKKNKDITWFDYKNTRAIIPFLDTKLKTDDL
ncbi:MAG: tRNA (adenosine(37)-N6)-dimethylallyltransferase MiaA [Flavobacteriaceae bacterium]